MGTGLRGCATAGADSAEPTLPDSTAVLAVLPLNRRQHVTQHSVNRFDGLREKAAPGRPEGALGREKHGPRSCAAAAAAHGRARADPMAKPCGAKGSGDSLRFGHE